ncbi:hypothetical protein [Thalassiella azotivora]
MTTLHRLRAALARFWAWLTARTVTRQPRRVLQRDVDEEALAPDAAAAGSSDVDTPQPEHPP